MVSETLQAACDNAIRCSRRGDTRAGIDLARHAYRLARQESPEAELEALNASALCQSANGSFIESIATSIDVISLARQQLNRRSAAFALATMAGAASFILDANNVVLEMLQVCRSEADALTDVPLKVRIHNTFGLVYGNLARFDDADREYDLGIALVLKADERAGLFTPATCGTRPTWPLSTTNVPATMSPTRRWPFDALAVTSPTAKAASASSACPAFARTASRAGCSL